MYTFSSPVNAFLNLQKNTSRILSMLKKRRQFWNLHRILNKTSNPDFRLIFLMKEDFCIKITITFFSPEKPNKKIENRDSKFC